MKITSLLSNLITENARLQLLFDKFVKPNPKMKSEPGRPAKGIMDFDTLKNIILKGRSLRRNKTVFPCDNIRSKYNSHPDIFPEGFIAEYISKILYIYHHPPRQPSE